MELKVCKFGGTSMATYESIKTVKSIIESEKSRRFVVVSAPGKRFKNDEKVTDILYACYNNKGNIEAFNTEFDKIKDRFNTLVEEFKLDLDFAPYFEIVKKGILSSTTPDYAASRGEYLSAILTSKILGMEFVDSAEIIRFNDKGVYDQNETDKLIRGRLSLFKGAVIPGFYGAQEDGTIRTFSRGGSDFTGSIIANGVEADIYENWTDVNGFMVTDPRIVPNPEIIKEISYDELRELSYMGASVLHPASTYPIQNAGIPINIRNTFNPSAPGTMIVKQIDNLQNNKNIITGIAGKKDFTTIFIKKALINSEVGYIRRILSILEEFNINIEHLPTGIDTVSLIVPNQDIANSAGIEKILEAIRERIEPDLLYVYRDIALIAIVGHGMNRLPGTAARVFTALAKQRINIRMIDQGSSELNIILGVDNDNMEKAIAEIYKEFIH